jgi:hypothetical protein
VINNIRIVKITIVIIYITTLRRDNQMPKGKNQHVVPNNGEWGVKGAGNEKMTRTFETQREAISYAKQVAQNQGSEMFIHNQQGQIRERNTYGKDNFPPKG